MTDRIAHFDLVRDIVEYHPKVVLKPTIVPMDLEDSSTFYYWLLEVMDYWESPHGKVLNGDRKFMEVCQTWYGLTKNLTIQESIQYLKNVFFEIQDDPELMDGEVLTRLLEMQIEEFRWTETNIQLTFQNHLQRYYPDVDRSKLLGSVLESVITFVQPTRQKSDITFHELEQVVYGVSIPEGQSLTQTQMQIAGRIGDWMVQRLTKQQG